MNKNKTTAIAIALILMLTMTISLVALPTTNAIGGPSKSYAFIGAVPNPVGVDQETKLHIGITSAIGTVQSGWTGLIVTVTKPDGTTETLDNGGAGFRTDSTGGTGTIYVPRMIGTYKLQTHFPAQWYNFSAGFPPTLYEIYYEAS